MRILHVARPGLAKADIPNISNPDAFYGLYYQPQNITIVLVGDFKPDDAEAMVLRYFGRIPAGTARRRVTTREPDQAAEKRMYAEAETNPQVDILWKTVAFQHRDSYPLDVLSCSSAAAPDAFTRVSSSAGRDRDVCPAGFTQMGRSVQHRRRGQKDGKTPEDVEQGIYAELERLKNEWCPPRNSKVKNQFAAFEYRKLSANFRFSCRSSQNEAPGTGVRSTRPARSWRR